VGVCAIVWNDRTRFTRVEACECVGAGTVRGSPRCLQSTNSSEWEHFAYDLPRARLALLLVADRWDVAG
jgi:hypothetical protein